MCVIGSTALHVPSLNVMEGEFESVLCYSGHCPFQETANVECVCVKAERLPLLRSSIKLNVCMYVCVPSASCSRLMLSATARLAWLAKAKAGPYQTLTKAAWVQTLPFLTHDACTMLANIGLHVQFDEKS